MASNCTNRIQQVRGGCQAGLLALAGSPLFNSSDKLCSLNLRALGEQSIVFLYPGFYLVCQGFSLQLNRHRLSAPGGLNWAYVASGAGVA